MTRPWFFNPGIPGEGEEVLLDDREARHAAGARRLRTGATVVLFDGRGVSAEAELIGAEGREARVRVVSRRFEPPPLPVVHLASALPKGDRQAVLLGMVTQLGVASFTPLHCERSVAIATEAFAARAQRICLEACKQSRRAHLPQIQTAATPSEIVRSGVASGALALFGDPRGERLRAVLDGRAQPPPEVVLLIGPEGGLTADEIQRLRALGARPMSLGGGVLRVETAAVAAVAAVMLVG